MNYEPIGDLESGLLGKIPPSNRGGSRPITRNRVGTASGNASLVANVATAYFQLRALDSELEISKRTLASRQESLS